MHAFSELHCFLEDVVDVIDPVMKLLPKRNRYTGCGNLALSLFGNHDINLLYVNQ